MSIKVRRLTTNVLEKLSRFLTWWGVRIASTWSCLSCTLITNPNLSLFRSLDPSWSCLSRVLIADPSLSLLRSLGCSSSCHSIRCWCTSAQTGLPPLIHQHPFLCISSPHSVFSHLRRRKGVAMLRRNGWPKFSDSIKRFKAGLSAKIYRLGLIGPGSRSGIGNPRDLHTLLFIAILRMHCYPSTLRQGNLKVLFMSVEDQITPPMTFISWSEDCISMIWVWRWSRNDKCEWLNLTSSPYRTFSRRWLLMTTSIAQLSLFSLPLTHWSIFVLSSVALSSR